MLKGWVLLSTHPVRSFDYLKRRWIQVHVGVDPRSVKPDLRLDHEIFDDSSPEDPGVMHATPLRRLDRGF